MKIKGREVDAFTAAYVECAFWPEPAATILDEASKRAGERNLYVGDDGKIYQSPEEGDWFGGGR